MTTILLTTDLSDESRQAFAPVTRLASTLQARVILFHVVQDPPPAAFGTPGIATPVIPSLDKLRATAELRLNELRGDFPDGLDVVLVIESGMDPATTIADYIREHPVDLIAMATHGRSGLRRALMGSVAEGVLRHVKAPLLLLPMPD